MQTVEKHYRAVVVELIAAYRFPDAGQREFAETFLQVPLRHQEWMTVEQSKQHLWLHGSLLKAIS